MQLHWLLQKATGTDDLGIVFQSTGIYCVCAACKIHTAIQNASLICPGSKNVPVWSKRGEGRFWEVEVKNKDKKKVVYMIRTYAMFISTCSAYTLRTTFCGASSPYVMKFQIFCLILSFYGQTKHFVAMSAAFPSKNYYDHKKCICTSSISD